MNKKIIAVLLMIICLGSIAGGVFSTVNAVEYNQTYETKKKTYDTFSKLAENSSNSKYNLTFFSDQMKEKADSIKEETDSVKSQLVKFAVLAGVLYFVAVMMLIGFAAILMKIKKEPKRIKEPRKQKKSEKQLHSDSEDN